MLQYNQLSQQKAHIKFNVELINYWIRSQTQKHTLWNDRKEKSRCRILPEAGSCKRKENPVQTPVCACVEPVKMPFCIRDRAHTVHTNTHTFFFSGPVLSMFFPDIGRVPGLQRYIEGEKEVCHWNPVGYQRKCPFFQIGETWSKKWPQHLFLNYIF